MRDIGNETPRTIKPSVNPATLPSEPTSLATAEDIGEGCYSGIRNYQASLKAYLETANVEKEGVDAAPKNDVVKREMEQAEAAGRKPASKGKQK